MNPYRQQHCILCCFYPVYSFPRMVCQAPAVLSGFHGTAGRVSFRSFFCPPLDARRGRARKLKWIARSRDTGSRRERFNTKIASQLIRISRMRKAPGLLQLDTKALYIRFLPKKLLYCQCRINPMDCIIFSKCMTFDGNWYQSMTFYLQTIKENCSVEQGIKRVAEETFIAISI